MSYLLVDQHFFVSLDKLNQTIIVRYCETGIEMNDPMIEIYYLFYLYKNCLSSYTHSMRLISTDNSFSHLFFSD